MFVEAYKKHLDNGVRLCKFDNFIAWCTNPAHDHFPGIYSTEAIQNSLIEFLTALTNHCPDLFIMLYWGYRSPWWLIHGDTIFEPGLCIEAASPGATPTPYARCGVNEGLDAAMVWAEEVPLLGKDSLGVWLSDWGWNSSIGTDKWQDGVALDITRGSLLPQIWSDWGLLDQPQRVELARFVQLVKQNEACFRNPRPVLGQAGTEQAYGTLCHHGNRAFLAIHNASWQDFEQEIHFVESLGLPGNKPWQAFRWHPAPAQLQAPDGRTTFSKGLPIILRPWKVCLIELVADNNGNCLGEPLPTQPVVSRFDKPTTELRIITNKPKYSEITEHGLTKKQLQISGQTTLDQPFKGMLQVSIESFDSHGKACKGMFPQNEFASTIKVNGKKLKLTPVLGTFTYPVNWQAWRKNSIRLKAGDLIELEMSSKHESLHRIKPSIRLIPE